MGTSVFIGSFQSEETNPCPLFIFTACSERNMARRERFNLTQAIELVQQDGSEDETSVDHYESSGESAEEDDIMNDIPAVVLHPMSEGEEGGELDNEIHPNNGDDSDSDRSRDDELEDGAERLYQADTEVDERDEEEEEMPDNTIWSKNLRNFPEAPPFTGNAGLRDVFDNTDPTPLQAYRVFFTDELMEKIKSETNHYARSSIAAKRRELDGAPFPKKSVFTRWSTVTLGDLRNFFACCIHMGIVKKPRISDYWSRHPALHASYCSQIMTRDRFTDILTFLHVNDNDDFIAYGQPDHDPIHKIRPLMTILNDRFQEVYVPNQNICVDEAMCPFKGRSRFKVYMKDKPTKWGFKFYELCESGSGYVFKFELFCADKRISNKPVDVVMRLMGPLLNQGYHLYVDNYYCCPQLSDALTAQGTMVCGTVRKNRVGMPKELALGNFQVGQMDYRRKGNLVACRWKDKKDVYMLSTLHRPTLQITQARYERKEKPLAVINYIANMSGVDTSDQMMSYFPMHRKSMKWWKKPFFHLMTLLMIQARAILNKHRQARGRSVLCLEDVVKSVLLTLPQQEMTVAHVVVGDKLRLTGRHFLQELPATATKVKPYKNCKVCYARDRATGTDSKDAKSRRKQTRFWCPDCNVALCVVPCFHVWHTKKDVLSLRD